MWCNMYNGKHLQRDTITHGHQYISNAFISILGGTQPDEIMDFIRKNTNNGLVDRILFIYPDYLKNKSFEDRPWGKFDVLLDAHDCKVKKLTIFPNKRLSLQYHNYRSEHWLVVKGEANIFIDGLVKILKPGSSIDIPRRSQHFIENKKNETLIILETQLGTYFGEDDIVRLDDPYNRK